MDLVTLALAKNYTDEVAEESGGSGSAAQVQADWNQSDETAVDFIKNRTHYDFNKKITQVLTFSEEPNTNGWYLSSNMPTGFDSYQSVSGVVTVNGENYNFTTYGGNLNDVPEEKLIKIGSASLVAQVSYPGYWSICFYSTEYFPSIEVTIESIGTKQLDERYIPDTIARQADIEHISSIVDYGKVTNPTLSSDLIISPTVNEILLIKDLSSFEGSPLLDYYTYSYVLDGKNTYSPMIHYTTTTSIDSSYWLLDKPSTIYQMSTKKVNFYHKIGTVAKVYFVTELASLSDSELTKFPQLGIYLEVLKSDKIASLEVIYNHITKLGDQFLSNRAQGAIERVEKEFDTKLGYIDIKTDIMEWVNNQSFPDLGSDFLNQAVIVYNMGIYIGRNYSYGLYSFLGGEARVFQTDVTTLNGSIYVELYWVNQYLCKIIIPESSDEQLMGQFSHLLAPMTVMLNFEGSNTWVAFWSNDMTDITDIKNQIVGDIVDVEDPFAFWIWIGWKMRHREDIMIGTYYSDEYSVKYDFTSLAALTITLEDNSIIKLFIDESNNYCGEVTLSNGNSKLLYKATDLESYENFQQIDYKPTGYAEPTEDTGVANKKYVDNAIAAALADLGIAEEGVY